MATSYAEISHLLGQTIVEISAVKGRKEISIETEEKSYRMFHSQDCCEEVLVEDIIGDLEDLIGSPILMAEEVSEGGKTESGTFTWTFYKLATIKGYVTFRWYGVSNGHYSEKVEIEEEERDIEEY